MAALSFFEKTMISVKKVAFWFAETNDGEPLNRLTFNTMTFSQKMKTLQCHLLSEKKQQNNNNK